MTAEDTLETEGKVESGDCKFNCKIIKKSENTMREIQNKEGTVKNERVTEGN